MYRPVPTSMSLLGREPTFGKRTHVAGLVVMIEDFFMVEATEKGCGLRERGCGGAKSGSRECSAQWSKRVCVEFDAAVRIDRVASFAEISSRSDISVVWPETRSGRKSQVGGNLKLKCC